MKRILYFFSIMLAVLIASCDSDNPWGDEELKDGEGQLSLSRLMVTVENNEKEVRAAVDPALFQVIITDKATGSVKEKYQYAEMPEVVVLPVGEYTVKVRSSEPQAAAWDAPYYEGEADVKIESKQVSSVTTITCRLANVRVSVFFDAALKAVMGADCMVGVHMGESGTTLSFTKDETRSGYFEYVAGSNTLVAVFSGTVDGYLEKGLSKTYNDVQPGSHYKITFIYSPSDNPSGTGGIENPLKKFSIKTRVERVDINGNHDFIEGGGNDNGRPGDGNDDGGDDPVTPPDPVDGGPTITPTDSRIKLGEPNDINEINGNNIPVVLNIHADNGISGFTVSIASDNTMFAAAIEDLFPGSEFDLLDPATEEIGTNLSSLGLPVGDDVRGKTDVPFDITKFMELLDNDAFAGVHKFTLKVSETDASGKTLTTEKTLIIKKV